MPKFHQSTSCLILLHYIVVYKYQTSAFTSHNTRRRSCTSYCGKSTSCLILPPNPLPGSRFILSELCLVYQDMLFICMYVIIRSSLNHHHTGALLCIMYLVLKKFINNSRGKYKRNECLINVCKSDKDLS